MKIITCHGYSGIIERGKHTNITLMSMFVDLRQGWLVTYNKNITVVKSANPYQKLLNVIDRLSPVCNTRLRRIGNTLNKGKEYICNCRHDCYKANDNVYF